MSMNAESKELLINRLREAANAQSMLDVANFQFIGLDDIRRAYGEHWPERRRKILEISHNFLSKRLNEKDVLIPGSSGFVLVFVDDEQSVAAQKASQLSNALNTFILGELKDPLGPKTEVETLSVHVDDFVKTIDTGPNSDSDEASEKNESTLDWCFQPQWNVKHEALSGYYISPIINSTQGTIPGYLGEKTHYTASFYEELDMASLKQSDRALKEMLNAGNRALVGVSIHAQTLANTDSRTRLLHELNSYDKRHERYRVIKISSVPPGFPTLYLEEVVRTLKPITSNVAISLSSDETDFQSFMKLGVQSLGIAIPESITDSTAKIQMTLLYERIKFATALCHNNRIATFVEGPFNNQQAMRFCALGVDVLMSSKVWGPQTTMGSMSSWPADRLMSVA